MVVDSCAAYRIHQANSNGTHALAHKCGSGCAKACQMKQQNKKNQLSEKMTCERVRCFVHSTVEKMHFRLRSDFSFLSLPFNFRFLLAWTRV